MSPTNVCKECGTLSHFLTHGQEDMYVPRVGGDATILPNGDIVLTGGAQSGCSGGTEVREWVDH
jgi:hypothetical protein